MNKPVAWPEKVYLRTNPDAFDQGLPENRGYQGTMWTWLHEKEKAYSVEYIRADLASPLTQEEMRQVLEALIRSYLGAIYQLAHLLQLSHEAAYEHTDAVEIRKQIAILKGKLE